MDRALSMPSGADKMSSRLASSTLSSKAHCANSSKIPLRDGDDDHGINVQFNEGGSKGNDMCEMKMIDMSMQQLWQLTPPGQSHASNRLSKEDSHIV